MESDADSGPDSIPKLPLFSIPPHLHEPSGMLTPPLQTSASVPFRWEEQPGKPRPCTDIIVAPTNRCLDLPPRLANKTPSPTTVLDGPGDFSGKSLLSSSFRFARERRRKGQRQGSFDSSCSGGWSPNDDSCGGQQLLLGNKQEQQNGGGGGGRGLFGSFRLKCSHKSKGSSSLISPSSSSSMETVDKKGKKMRRNSSLSKVTRSHFWAAIYEGFKHVVPWKKKTFTH
ncbi:uncharacterized protein At4g00950 [Cynara cardunculus var. scolymus]|uniref:Uncharacterized protein n=1 Tax=Cynara cardunculus var. scolymus TaxID=59895 RepID=A0A124SDL2_CYNCS|nr:uncharacterized protein At4g00950 [Cynara cardunculus var. scolymus]KVH97315.1 hypothetical protein Ccrd_000585 [Cynara cardunculus var. scolymus]